MKKTFLAVLFLSLAACSSDSSTSNGTPDGGSQPQVELKIKSITEQNLYTTTPTTITYNFNYDSSDKLVSISYPAENLVTRIQYSGDKIVKFDTYNSSNVLTKSGTVTYDGDKLMSVVGETEKTEFTYVNGVVKTKKRSTRTNVSSAWEFYDEETYSFNQSKNVNQVLTKRYDSPATYKSTFEHDNKKNPLSGMNPYLKYLLHFESFKVLDQNNRASEDLYLYEGGPISAKSLFQSQYNAAGYPTEIKRVPSTYVSVLSKITITYN